MEMPPMMKAFLHPKGGCYFQFSPSENGLSGFFLLHKLVLFPGFSTPSSPKAISVYRFILFLSTGFLLQVRSREPFFAFQISATPDKSGKTLVEAKVQQKISISLLTAGFNE